MTDVLAQFGVGGDDLTSQLGDAAFPPQVQGRVAHIDADFMSYHVAAETADELQGVRPRRSMEDMQNAAREIATYQMRMAGATSYVCHITPSGSNKGNRPAQAVQQEYQATRADKEKPERLDAIRAFIGQELNGAVHLDQEADDGMAQANYGAEDRNLSVIVSRDKDLRMVPGLHFDFDTDTVIDVSPDDTYGHIYIDDTKSSKTCKGWGTAFLWAQCLMGDTADNIKGLPAIAGPVHCSLLPTKTYLKAREQLVKAEAIEDPAKRERYSVGPAKLMNEAQGKTKPCGQVATFDLLKDIRRDRDAFEFVRGVWQELSDSHGWEYTHWRTGAVVTPTQALLGDMQLLWMRRNKNPLDVVDWVRSR